MHARISLIIMNFKEKNGRTFANRVRGRTPSNLLLQNLPFILLLLTLPFTFPISDFSPYHLSNFLFEFCLFCSKSSWTATVRTPQKFRYKSWKLLCMSKIADFFTIMDTRSRGSIVQRIYGPRTVEERLVPQLILNI